MPAEFRLSVKDGDNVREVTLVGTVTVGRGPACEISSSDPRLSRTHAAFDVVDGNVVVRDLDSRNGTTVNGAAITEHRLQQGEQVEVGPFIIELLPPTAVVRERRPAVNSDNEATVMLPARSIAAALSEPAAAATPAPPPPQAQPVSRQDSSSRTRVMQRPSTVEEILKPPSPPRVEADPPTRRLPITAPPVPPAKVAPRPATTDLAFANTALLWIVPVVLVSFLAGLVPDLIQPDERAPLLRAHYLALATAAVDLAKASHEPVMPIDNITTALRAQAGVTAARVIGADGRVLAPLDQAATVLPPPSLADPAPRITDATDGAVDVQVAARTADGKPVMIAMTVDPEKIHPASGGSPVGTVLLILSLGAAWLVARQLTQITDARLSRLGEEVELLTTHQISSGHDPFNLSGGRRILDAVTFAASPAGRVSPDAPRGATRADAPGGDAPNAAIDADANFRIVSVDKGCESLLGINSNTAPGMHLIDALPDQAIADEVMRLVTMATPAQAVDGEVVSTDRSTRMRITVTAGAADAPFAIRFKRL